MTAFFDTTQFYIYSRPMTPKVNEQTHTVWWRRDQRAVFNEIVNVCRRKRRLEWSAIDEIMATVRALLTIVPLTTEVHDHGLRLARRYQFAVYDSMIVAAALAANCETLWSEDMHDGLVVDSQMTTRNPFG